MAVHRVVFYLLALLVFIGFCAVFPTDLDPFSFVKAENLTLLLALLVLVGAYLAFMTVFCVTQIAFSEIAFVVIVSFIIATFTVKLPHSLGVLFVLPYCYKVRMNTQMLRKPDPGFSSTIVVPSLFFYLGVFGAILIFITAVPSLKPENLPALDQFASLSTGCPADQALDACIADMVSKQTQYPDLLRGCDTYVGGLRDSCLSQVNQQYQRAVSQTEANYGQSISLNQTVAEFYQDLAAQEVNDFAAKNESTFKLLLAVLGFSLVSSLGSPVTIVVAFFASLMLRSMMSMGIIKQSLSKEQVFNYLIE